MSYIKRLYRSTRDRIFGGVCSGLGQYFNVDANIIRLIWVIIAFIWPTSILVYFIMWIIIPKESDQEPVYASVV